MSLCSSGTYILRCFWQAANENLPPNVIKQLAKELKNLNETPPEGIKVIVNDDDFSTIYADIEGPGRSQPWTALFLTASSFWYHGWRVVYVSEHCSWNSIREWYFPHEVVIISWLPSVTAQRYAFYTRYKTVPVYCMTFLIKKWNVCIIPAPHFYRLLHDKNLSPKYCNKWWNLCEHTQKGLESKSWFAACSYCKLSIWCLSTTRWLS